MAGNLFLLYVIVQIAKGDFLIAVYRNMNRFDVVQDLVIRRLHMFRDDNLRRETCPV